MSLPYETMKRTTELTQATFTPDAVLSPQATQGNLPTATALQALFALDEKFKGRRDVLHNAAFTYQPLKDLVSQYIDPNTGEPLAGARAQNGGVALGDKFACFGRGCGEQPGCFSSCSLGPSHMANGQPLGPVGLAPIRWPNGQISGGDVEGVLKSVDGNISLSPDGKARHRDNACLLLSFGNKIFSIPPAPAGDLCDKLFAMMPDIINHAINTAVVPAAPTQTMAPPQQASPQPSVAPPPPVMGGSSGLPSTVPPPPGAVGLPAGGVAPPPQTPPPQQQQAPAADTFPVVKLEMEADKLTEIRALVLACTRSELKPMSETAAQNMLTRHIEKGSSAKALRSSWIKAGFDRGLTDSSTASGKMLQEHWPKDIPQIAGYWDEAVVDVPVEPTVSPEAVPTPEGPVLAPPPGTAPTYQLKPGAPAKTPQKIDAVERALPEQVQNAGAVISNNKEVAEYLRDAGNALLNAAAALMSEPDDGNFVMKPVPVEMPVEEMPVKERAQKMAKATKKKTAKPKAAKKPTTKKAAKKPAVKKSAAKKATVPVGAKPHPKHPDVHAAACKWQPGTRGRPPKGVTRSKRGVLKFGKGWREINGKWHAPLKA